MIEDRHNYFLLPLPFSHSRRRHAAAYEQEKKAPKHEQQHKCIHRALSDED